MHWTAVFKGRNDEGVFERTHTFPKGDTYTKCINAMPTIIEKGEELCAMVRSDCVSRLPRRS